MDKTTLFRLIDKYQNGAASEAEKALLETYYQRLEEAGSTGLTADEEQALKNTMYQQVMTGISHHVNPIQRNYRQWTAAAAN